MCHKRGDKDFSEVLFGSNTNPTPKLQCKKCSLNITEDGRAVVLQCFECFEVEDDKQVCLLCCTSCAFSHVINLSDDHRSGNRLFSEFH